MKVSDSTDRDVLPDIAELLANPPTIVSDSTDRDVLPDNGSSLPSGVYFCFRLYR